MKKILLLALLICSLSSFSQGVVVRAGYSYSPEDGLLILPPVHLSAEYQFSYPYTSYIGACTGGSIAVSAWGGVGLYYGFKMKSFFIENRFNWFFVLPNELELTKTTQFSINPKIGFEKHHLYIKAGPYFGIHENPDNLLNLNYLHIKNVMIDVEAGYYFSTNEEEHRLKKHKFDQR